MSSGEASSVHRRRRRIQKKTRPSKNHKGMRRGKVHQVRRRQYRLQPKRSRRRQQRRLSRKQRQLQLLLLPLHFKLGEQEWRPPLASPTSRPSQSIRARARRVSVPNGHRRRLCHRQCSPGTTFYAYRTSSRGVSSSTRARFTLSWGAVILPQWGADTLSCCCYRTRSCSGSKRRPTSTPPSRASCGRSSRSKTRRFSARTACSCSSRSRSKLSTIWYRRAPSSASSPASFRDEVLNLCFCCLAGRAAEGDGSERRQALPALQQHGPTAGGASSALPAGHDGDDHDTASDQHGRPNFSADADQVFEAAAHAHVPASKSVRGLGCHFVWHDDDAAAVTFTAAIAHQDGPRHPRLFHLNSPTERRRSKTQNVKNRARCITPVLRMPATPSPRSRRPRSPLPWPPSSRARAARAIAGSPTA
jgi:hypothetical protein